MPLFDLFPSKNFTAFVKEFLFYIIPEFHSGLQGEHITSGPSLKLLLKCPSIHTEEDPAIDGYVVRNGELDCVFPSRSLDYAYATLYASQPPYRLDFNKTDIEDIIKQARSL